MPWYRIGDYGVILTDTYLQISNHEIYPTLSLRLPITKKLQSVVHSENQGHFESGDLRLSYATDRIELTLSPDRPGHMRPWINVIIGIPKDVIDTLYILGKSLNAKNVNVAREPIKKWLHTGGKRATRKTRK